MKKTFFVTTLGIAFILCTGFLHAQDSTKTSVKKQMVSENEKADNLNGKKIQQQSLSASDFEKTGAVDAKPAKRKIVKNKHKRQ